MKRRFWGLAVLLVMTLPLLLASCGGDDNKTTEPSKADLVVLSVTWNPTSPQTDQAVTVSITVKNDGDFDAPASSTRLTVNGTASCSAIVTPVILKGAQTTVTCDIGGHAAGTYTLVATADVAGLIDEGDEANNARTATMTVTAPPAPDLIIQSITFNPDPPLSNAPVTARIQVKNQGTVTAEASITSSSLDGSPACQDITTTSIAAGQSVIVQCDLGTLTAGNHAAAATADAGAAIAEADETNNSLSVNFTVSEPPTYDLVVDAVTFTPSQPVSGESVTAHVVVKNVGNAAAAASVTSTSVDGSDQCAAIATSTIAAGGSVTVDCALGQKSTGTYSIEACADAGAAIGESDETNNCRTASLTVSAPPAQADMVIDAITFTPSAPVDGQAVTAHIVVKNRGGAAAAATTTLTQLGGVDKCTPATIALAAGASTTVDCALGTLSTGSFTVRACADNGSIVAESDETNNCLSETLDILPTQADLIVDAITFTPAAPQNGQAVTAHIFVRNQGGTAAAATTTLTQLGGVDTCTPSTIALAAGASTTVDCALGTLSTGSYTVRACADNGSLVTESDETNNCDELTLEVAPQGADLVIDEISFIPAAPTQGQPVTAQVTVHNAGGTLAAGSKTRIRLDGTSTCSEVLTSSLPAGSSVVVNCNLGTPSAGEHSVEACADIASEVTEADESNNCATETLTVAAAQDFPAFPIPDVSTCVDFQSSDPNAVAAQQTVQMQLTLVSTLSSLGTYFFLPLQGAEWTDQGGGCWSWDYSAQGCDWSYRVCQSGSGWEWTLTINGTCDNTTYNNWVAFRATMNTADGTSGLMKYYDENSTNVAGSWTWEVAADGKSGTWGFYEGDASAGGVLNNQISWAKNGDNSQDTTWIIPESMKSETHVSADCRSGYYKQYMWTGTPEAWHLYNEITWSNDGHGSNVTYDTETGEEISREDW
jgi:subtilase family serine protease